MKKDREASVRKMVNRFENIAGALAAKLIRLTESTHSGGCGSCPCY